MSLIFDGKSVDIPELVSIDFQDNPKFKLSKRGYHDRPENIWIRGIVIHTRMGIETGLVLSNKADRKWDELVARRWDRSGRMAGAHIAVDADGSYSCMCDIIKHSAHHAGHVNDFTVGIEMYQGGNGVMYQPTIAATVKIVDVLTRELGIQRQVPVETAPSLRILKGGRKPWKKSRRLAWTMGGKGGEDYTGVYGHRNVTRNRGRGDPGDQIFAELVRLGYEIQSIDNGEDKRAWIARQYKLGVSPDGIPGPKTRAALEAFGFHRGLYINRPCDTEK